MQAEELPTESREVFNRKLEDWFNVDAPESPIFVRYNWCFGPDTGTYQTPTASDIDTDSINKEDNRAG